MILLRSALFNAYFVALTLLLGLAGVGFRLLSPGRIPGLTRFWVRAVVGAARVICGIRFRVVGLDRLPPGPCLIAARHQSAYDALVWMLLAPRCCYVLKRELTRIPLVGPLIVRMGMIVVDRERGATAMRALLRQADRAVREGRQIVIFPEGTRAPDQRLLPLQPGVAAIAARTGLPVFPVVTDAWRVWGRRAFRKRPGVVRFVILPPIEAGLAREELMRRLSTALSATPAEVTPPEDAAARGA